jgi:hypothetical protein
LASSGSIIVEYSKASYLKVNYNNLTGIYYSGLGSNVKFTLAVKKKIAFHPGWD